VLKVLIEDPTGDERIRAAVEELLDDRTPCVVMIPIRYGEVRWLAAHALAAERRAAGLDPSVRLAGVTRPIDTGSLSVLADEVLGSARPAPPLEERFRALQVVGRLPTYDLEIR
jgi:hypothetical protein